MIYLQILALWVIAFIGCAPLMAPMLARRFGRAS